MSASIVIDWQRSPPALGLALSRGQHRSHSGGNGDAIRECIQPALAATTSAGFVREVSRRLPLFAALHAKEIDKVDALDHAAAVWRSASRSPQLESPSSSVDSDGAEDSFWALAGTLPLLEIGAAA